MKNYQSLKYLSCALLFFSMTVKAEESRYPLRVIDRPGIVPQKIVNVDIDTKLKNLKTVDLGIGSSFGIVKKLQGNFSYEGFQFNPFVAKTTLHFGVKYNYLSLPGFSAYLVGDLPVNLNPSQMTVKDLTIGLPVVFYTDILAFGALSDLFHLIMRPNFAADINLKAWFGIQVYGNLWADLSTKFGKISIINENKQASVQNTWFWQSLPLELALIYGLTPHFDIGASVGYDNIIAAKDLTIGLKLTVRGGKLFE